MAISKNKIQIRDLTISIRSELQHYFDWDCDYDWYQNESDYYSYAFDIDYDYLPNTSTKEGIMIDMESFYSKENLRNKRINYLLGLDSSIFNYYSNNTIGDFWNIQ